MLTIAGPTQTAFCDGVARRNFLRIGAAGVGSLGSIGLDTLLRAATPASGGGTEGSVIMIYLPGGPTQHETFDPKPDAPREIRGSFGPISTRVPGVQFCQLLPKLAAMNDKFSIVRSLVGMQNRHESFQCYTGRPGGRPGDGEPAGGWPSLGSVASRVKGARSGRGSGVVPYVDAAPRMGHAPYRNRAIHDGVGTTSWPGFTGRQHIPFTIEGEVKSDLVLQGVSMDRLKDRHRLLESLHRHQAKFESQGSDKFQRQAFGLLSASGLAEAMNLEREAPKTRRRYGTGQPTHASFGGAPQNPQHLLMARRLVEAGVRVVTVAFGAWDWHANREGSIEFLSNKYLPVFDHAIRTLLEDLEQRGLLDTVSVVVWGEFGRTPRINPKGGRDHWPGTQSVLLAGGGIRGGRVVGTTDPQGGVPASRPVHVQEVFATLYRTLGIDVNTTKIADLSGRPRYLVENNRQPIAELF